MLHSDTSAPPFVLRGRSSNKGVFASMSPPLSASVAASPWTIDVPLLSNSRMDTTVQGTGGFLFGHFLMCTHLLIYSLRTTSYHVQVQPLNPNELSFPVLIFRHGSHRSSLARSQRSTILIANWSVMRTRRYSLASLHSSCHTCEPWSKALHTA